MGTKRKKKMREKCALKEQRIMGCKDVKNGGTWANYSRIGK